VSTPVSAAYFDGRSAKPYPVTLTLKDGLLEVRGDSIQRDAPLTALRVSEPMGLAPRLISFPDGAHCEVRDHAGMQNLLAISRFEDSWVVRIQNRWRWAAASAVIAVAAVFATYHWGLPAASEWIAYHTPEKFLAKMGSGTLTILDKSFFSPSKLPDARQQALRNAFDRLITPGGARPRYTLLFRHSEAVGANAMALPDGTVVITDQLIALAVHDEEILAVLAHELGHLSRRHSLRMMIQGSVVAFVASWYLGDVSSVAAGLPTLLLQARYSRDHEREADQYGAAMLKANGISARRLADMLGKLEASHREKRSSDSKDKKDDEPKTKAENPSSASDYLRSHPATRERIDALNNAAQ
jgi:Zn-dependent protease with chaperone function